MRLLVVLLVLAWGASASAQDAGVPDAGVPDAGVPDAGAPDAGPDTDAGADADADADADAGAGADAGADADADAGTDSEGLFGLSDDDVLAPSAGADDELLSDDAVLADIVDDERDLEVGGPDGVVVEDSAIDTEEAPTGGAVQRLDAELLERFNYDNADAVIQQVPGAYVRQEDGYGLRPNIGLRGVSSERSSRISLMEDGVLFGPAPYAAPAAYYFPVMTRLAGVDVYMGAATIPYGPNTVGGAIDLRNREFPEEADGGLDLALGTNWFGRGHGWVGLSNDWGAFLVEGVYLHSDGFKTLSGVPEGLDDTGFDRGEIVMRGELHGSVGSDAYQRLELRLGFSGESSRETYLGLSQEDFDEDPYQRYSASQLGHMEWWRTQVQLRHTLEVGDGFVLRSAAYRHDLDRAWLKVNAMGGLPSAGGSQVRVGLFDALSNTGGASALLQSILRGDEDGGLDSTSNDYVLIGTNARVFGVTGVQTAGTGQFSTGPLDHVVRAGVRLHHDAVDRHHTEDAYSTISGQLVRATPESYTTRLTHAESLALSLHAAWGVTLFERVTVTPGVRAELIWTTYEDMQSTEPSQPRQFRPAVLPGVAAEWQIIDELAVFAGVMRGFAPVAPGQAEVVQAEDSINYELGMRLDHASSRTNALVTAFVNDYANYLQQCSFAAGCTNEDIDSQANGGRPIVAGFDVRLGLEPRVGSVRFPLRASYTFTYSELREDIPGSPSPLFRGAVAGDSLPYIPQHQVSAQAGVEHEDVGINVGASYVTEMLETARRFDDADAILTDDIFLLDATVYLQVFENLRVYVRGENLTFTQRVAARRPLGARPNRPFQLQVGVRVTP